MKKVELQGFKMVGVSVRTSNLHGQAAKDIPALWAQFQEEKPLHELSNKATDEMVCAYTEYESDHNSPYTVVLGFKVKDFEGIPSFYNKLVVPGGYYENHTAEDDLIGGAIVEKWHKIWETSKGRDYKVDFELYGKEAMNPRNGSCDIYISVN